MNEPRRFMTLEQFVTLLGYKSVVWYYEHKDDPGMPRRVYFGRKPMLAVDEVVAYQEQQMQARDPQPKKSPPERPRRVGRPVSMPKRLGAR
jgi:hypothetical protein